MFCRARIEAVVCSNCSPGTKSKWRTIGRDLGQSEEHLTTIASLTDSDDDRLWEVLMDWEEGIHERHPNSYNILAAVLLESREDQLASALKVAIQKQHTAPG